MTRGRWPDDLWALAGCVLVTATAAAFVWIMVAWPEAYRQW